MRSVLLVAAIPLLLCIAAGAFAAQAAYVPFEGERSSWHDGFDRFDFVMECATKAITPIKQPENEHFGIGPPQNETRRCVVVCPKRPAPGNPWCWRGCYWDHQPQTEIALLKRGFHIAYISADSNLKPDPYWDAWYSFLTEKHGLSLKPAFIGMSRGGEYAFQWAVNHTGSVTAIYADNPGGNDDMLRRLPDLARADVPVLLVCGSIDPIVQRFALNIESCYLQYGGRVSMMLKDGAGHHPHSLNDPAPLADFIESSFNAKPPPTPGFAGNNRYTRSTYYSLEETYTNYPQDGWFITTRGAAFSPVYNRYDVSLGFATPTTIIAPQTPAAGNPWVYRAGYVARGAAFDQALLAHGYHIVVGPIGFNADGADPAEWTRLYTYLTGKGFSLKPVLEGEGGAAGTVYAWAEENPDKVGCIYAENPILRAPGFRTQPIDNLAPLAKAGVPILQVCGRQDQSLENQSRLLEKRYRELGGSVRVLADEAGGHSAASPRSVKDAVEFVQTHR